MQEILSRVPAKEIVDINHGLCEIAYDKGKLIKKLENCEKYYKLLLKFPLPREVYQAINVELKFLETLLVLEKEEKS